MSLRDIRRDYEQRQLNFNDLNPDPFVQFQQWFDEVIASEWNLDPTAMTLATCANDKPTQRIVLLKDMSADGFVFYTNYQSQKGQQLLANPNCSLHFAWLPMERQVTVEGAAERLSEAENTAYFQSRPRASQLAAWASQQSQFVAGRDKLDAQYREVEARFSEQETLPLPPFWGGFRVRPTQFEFWQGRAARLHDRFRYRYASDNWVLERLQP
ncbi:pyridoxamine 5'-phosphate oxidase [Aliidiomarina sanyensis]|uniref:Pyridoxine/pyridoxamine 5'-phosphate oxidase n=1 Tax=Aliidiomarina sanyensis TaxID=1249555 RepID=A0A432WBN3_9GAMM|nr:pyridoxamine 5'-phosphate oxidase [Aliidiomarina sanyensis]RUO29079.1 pyridoxamine 5'-phosphate oxidase [Aliidiomarina sanyensis]